MKRAILVTFLIVAGIGTFAIINRNPVEQSQLFTAQQTRQISLFHYFSGSLSGGIHEMIDTVNKRNRLQQIHAQALDHEAFKSMIHTTLTRGNPPELFSYWAGAKTQAIVDQGRLEPIDDIWASSPLVDRFSSPVATKASLYNGKRYLLPITQHYVGFFYNKNVFAKEKLTEPTSWQELVNLAYTLKARGYTPFALGAKERWPAQFWFDYLLLRTAGPTYRQALMDGEASYTDPQVRKAFAMWATLLQKNYFNENANILDWDEAARNICSESAVMTLMGTWLIQLLTADNCGLKEQSGFDFFAFPTIEENIEEVALGPVDGFVLAKESPDPEFAKEVLVYFAENQAQEQISIGSGAFSPSNLIPAEFYSPLKQRILKASQKASRWAFNYDLATDPAISDKGMDSFNELIAFPSQSIEILENLQHEVEKLTMQKTPN